MLALTKGLPAVDSSAPFSDVPESHWACGEINAAAKAGLVRGFPDSTFQPEKQLSRAEAATLLFRLADFPVPSVTAPVVNDVKPNHWAYRPVTAAIEAGIAGISSDKTRFAPDLPFTRGEMARGLAITIITCPYLNEALPEGKLTVLKGKVLLIRSGQSIPLFETETSGLRAGDILKTDQNGIAEISFTDGTGIRIENSSSLIIGRMKGRTCLTESGTPGVLTDCLELHLAGGRLYGAHATRQSSFLKPEPAEQNRLPWNSADADKVWARIEMPGSKVEINDGFWEATVSPEAGAQVTLLVGKGQVTAGSQKVNLESGQRTQVINPGTSSPAPPSALTTTDKRIWLNVKGWALKQSQQIERQLPPALLPPPAFDLPANQWSSFLNEKPQIKETVSLALKQIERDLNSSGSAFKDRIPPAAPADLAAAPAGPEQINLAWTASTDNVGVVGYAVYRSSLAEGPFTQTATVSGTSCSDTGLSPATRYYYQVKAFDAAGNRSEPGNTASAITEATPDTSPPTAPSDLTAAPAGPEQINLTWTASADNMGVVGYAVYRSSLAEGPFTQTATVSGTSYSDTGLSPATRYYYQVKAFDAAGNRSEPGNTASARTLLAAGQTIRVSIASDGTQGNDSSAVYHRGSISADGRYVVFESNANNLVAGDTNGKTDIFAYDYQTGETTRVSVYSDGTQGNNSSFYPSISTDGRYVAFQSLATNLTAGDTNNASDIFVHNRETGETTRVSVYSDGTQGNGNSYNSSISADGRYVAFESNATNLVADDTNSKSDIFVHDRQTGETIRVSVYSDGTQGNNSSFYPSISTDGRYVAFQSLASNLTAGDTNNASDIFVHDRQTGQATRVSVASGGTQGNNLSEIPSISADGRYVAFQSLATNLTAGDTNSASDIFVHDRQTGQTTRVSVASGGAQGNGYSYNPSISADGRYIAFHSYATNLVAGDTNSKSDIFVHNRQTGQTACVSVTSGGAQGNGNSYNPSISPDGRYITFYSEATNLVSSDTNNKADVFVHAR